MIFFSFLFSFLNHDKIVRKFEKKVKKDYDIDYLLKNISNLKYQFINNEKSYEIKELFKTNNYPHKNGDDIYKIMREDTNFKKIGVDYCNIFEIYDKFSYNITCP